MIKQNMRIMGLSQILFAAGFIGLGVLSVIYGDSALVLQAMPHWVPWRGDWIYVCGILMLASGMGLFFTRTAALAVRTLLVYLLLWLLLLKVPILATAPSAIVSWETFGETAALLSGALVLFASLTGQGRSLYLKFAVGENTMRMARILFGIALFLFGLAHFGYIKQTAALVPAWLPWHLGWAYLTGAGYIAACIGILFRIYPRLAAALTAGMMGVFTLLIWIPGVAAVPTDQSRWAELLISWTLAASAWIVTDSYRGVPWLSIGKSSRAEANPDPRRSG